MMRHDIILANGEKRTVYADSIGISEGVAQFACDTLYLTIPLVNIHYIESSEIEDDA
jgi:hypothetical protein